MSRTSRFAAGLAIYAASLCFIDGASAAGPRGKLEYFDFKDLKIVTVDIIAGKWRACVYTPKAEAVIVTDGDGIGLAKGVISGLQKDGLRIRESVLNGSDWVEKRTFLNTADTVDTKAAKACKLKVDGFQKSFKKK